jgi:hypothetical protein
MATETMSFHRFRLADGQMANGWMSIKSNARLEGVRLRVKDFDGNVCEYLAKANGISFRSILSDENEKRPEMVRMLREAFDEWQRTSPK